MRLVEVSRISEKYFAYDGNHRISRARYHGVEWIDAEVTQFRALLPESRSVGNKTHRANQKG